MSFTVIDSNSLKELIGTTPTLSGSVVNAVTATHVPAVLQAIRLIAENVGSLPCKLYRRADKEAADDHVANRLAHERVNPWTSAGQLRVDLTADALLHGAGYAEIVRVGDDRRPVELHRLTPGTVQRRFKPDGEPVYIVSTKGQKQRHLSYRDVLYVPAFGGVAPVEAGKKALGAAMALERHVEQFFGSGARASTVITFPDKIPGSEAGAQKINNVRKQYKEWQENAAGEPLFLDGGAGISHTTMTSTDAQFLEHRVEQVREIARVFGVPPTMLYELSRGTYSNTEQMAASFLRLCLRPWLNRWQDAYTTALLTEDEQSSLYFEFITADLERADAAGRAEIYSKAIAAGWLNPNEVRARENLPAYEGGDKFGNPYTTTTTTTTGPAAVPAKENA